MEAPGLDFGGSGDDFCEIFARFGSGYLEAVPSVIPPTISPGILAIPQAFPPCQWTRRVTKNGQEESPSAKDTKNAKNCQESKELPLIAQNKRWVGGGDPPWGSSMELNLVVLYWVVFSTLRKNHPKLERKEPNIAPK